VQVFSASGITSRTVDEYGPRGCASRAMFLFFFATFSGAASAHSPPAITGRQCLVRARAATASELDACSTEDSATAAQATVRLASRESRTHVRNFQRQ